MHPLRFAGFILVAVLGSAAMPHTASACSCVPPPPPAVALADADAVFSGEVMMKEREGRDGAWRVTFRVDTAWKGNPGRGAVIHTANNSAACGFNFEKGERYLVYAYAHEGQLGTGLCTRTAALEGAGEDLEALGEASEETAYPGAGRCGGPTGAVAVQSVAFSLLGIALLRRRRASEDDEG